MSNLDLKRLRTELDKIDDSMLELLSNRFDISLQIAEVKKENELQVFQPKREAQLINNKSNLGNEYGLDKKFVKELWMNQKINKKSF